MKILPSSFKVESILGRNSAEILWVSIKNGEILTGFRLEIHGSWQKFQAKITLTTRKPKFLSYEAFYEGLKLKKALNLPWKNS